MNFKRANQNPTKDNILNSYNCDFSGRNEYTMDFIKFLVDSDDSATIALNGEWGIGKSFFVNTCDLILNMNNDIYENDEIYEKINEDMNDKKIDCSNVCSFYYDAWINDNSVDPVLSIIYNLINRYNSIYFDTPSEFDKDYILKFILPSKIAGAVDECKNNDILNEIKKEETLKSCINDFFSNINNENANKVIIFIDELDRCKPSYAIKLLERIKHYFYDVNNLIFVFSINIKELCKTIRNYYGNEFNAEKYLNKFFDIKFTLPSFDNKLILSDIDRKGAIMEVFKKCVNYFNLTPRDINNCKYLIESIDNISTDMYSPYNLGVIYLLPIMISLKVTDIIAYNKFIDGNSPEMFKDFMVNNYSHNIFKTLCCTGVSEFDAESMAIQFYKLIFSYDDLIKMSYRSDLDFLLDFKLFDSNIKNNLIKQIKF